MSCASGSSSFWSSAALTVCLALGAVCLALGAAGCHPYRPPPLHPDSPPGAWYTVGQGETLEQIASRIGVPAEDILELNGLTSAREVTPGRIIYLMEGPRAGIADGTSLPQPGAGAGSEPGLTAPPLPSASLMRASRSGPGGSRFRWPLDRTNVGSPFGTRDGRQHEGIDLPAPTGTPVYAAGDGQVVYAGDAIRGYGNLLVVQHDGDLLTVYAHNSQLLVREGDRVAVGQRIALVGQSGRATGPHLHFEVRSGQIPRDPMAYLPHSEPGGAP